MVIVTGLLGGLVLGEGAILWWLWTRWQSEKQRANANDLVARTAGLALDAALAEVLAVRRALAEHNAKESADDKARIEGAPGLDDALDRINGL